MYCDVSVIIPCFNSSKTIEKSILSVLDQTIYPREIICVDDGSQDNTVNIIFRLKKKSKIDIKIISQLNSGPSVARNKGILLSKSKYIAFLDSDDVWDKDKLKIQYDLMEKDNLSFTFHLYSPLGDFDLNKYKLKNKCKSISISKFIFKQYIATPTVMALREGFIAFNENLSHCEDYLCWIINNEGKKKIFFIDYPLASGFKKPIGDSGLSSNIYAMHKGFITANMILFRDNKINLLFLILSLVFEYLKFPFRYIR